MPESWAEVPLEAVADVIDPHPSHRAPAAVVRGIPFIGIGDFRPDGRMETGKARQVGEEHLEEHAARYQELQGLLAIGRVGSIGKVVRLPRFDPPYMVSPTLAIIHPRETDGAYLKISLESPLVQARLRSLVVGSTRPAVGIERLRTLTIPLPPRRDQRRIVDLVGSLDAAITTADDAVAKAEQARRAVLTDLIGPPSAQAESTTLSGASRPAVREGWTRATIGDVADAQRGYSYSSSELSDEPTDFGLVALKTVGRNGGFEGQGLRFLRRAAQSPATVDAGDLLVAATDLTRAREVLGNPILVPRGLPPESVFSLDMVKLVPDPKAVTTEFLDCVLQTPHTRRVIKGLGTGTTVLHLNVTAFLAVPILLPPLEEQQRIVGIVSTIDDEVAALRATAKAARAARAGILNELLAGTHEIPPSYDRLLEAA